MIPREVEVNQSALIRPGEIWKQLRKTIRELPLKKAIKKILKKRFLGRSGVTLTSVKISIKVLLENVRI